MEIFNRPIVWVLVLLSFLSIINYLRNRNKDPKTSSLLEGDLLESIKAGKLIKTSLLLGNGAKTSQQDEAGKNALITAAEHGKLKITAVLLDKSHNTDVNASDNAGKTALMYACQNGDIKMAALLLKHGANKSLSDNNGKTAIQYAEDTDKSKLIKMMHDVA